MDTTNLIKTTAQKLQRFFRIFVILNAIILIAALFIPNYIIIDETTHITYQSVLILYTLGMIPGALKFFQLLVKRIANDSTKKPIDKQLKLYTSCFYLRWFALDSIVTFNVAAYIFSNEQSYLMLGLIGAIALLFCNTSEESIKSELNLREE